MVALARSNRSAAGSTIRRTGALVAALVAGTLAHGQVTVHPGVEAPSEALDLSVAGLTPGQTWERLEGIPQSALVPKLLGGTTAGGNVPLGRPPCLDPFTSERNPGGQNPRLYIATAPTPGLTQKHTVYTGYTGRYTMAIIRGFSLPASTLLPGGQLLLVNTASRRYFQIGPVMGPMAEIRILVPNDPAICGVYAYAQAYVFDPTGTWPFVLSNAVDMFTGNCTC